MTRLSAETCLLLLVLSTCSIALTKAAGFYSCPELDPDTVGMCVEECSSHSDCDGEYRCCSNGCGHTCTPPITIPYHEPTLACPDLEEEIAGVCAEECEEGCDEGELCCSNGCGHVCTRGVLPAALCSTLRDRVMNSTLIGAFVPQCEEDGSYSAVQCHGSTGYCWCVAEETGEPVSDMTRFRQPQCNCSYNGQVFRAGDTFPPEDADGCFTCSCLMDGEVSCQQSECTEDTYLSCPAVRAGATTHSDDCDGDCLLHNECSSDRKCCYNGCGYSCMQPHRIPFIDISSSYVRECPDSSQVPCAMAMGSCREAEFRCEEGQMCCDNDCASSLCISMAPGSPCRAAVQLATSANTSELLGRYRPQCTTQGLFRDIQCHAHFCWCVESGSGVPVSDIVPFEHVNVLACAECVYNGLKYQHLESFPSTDCNTCTCIGGTISCSGVDCDDYGGEDGGRELWQWWHSMLIGCVVVVVVLVSIVLALLVGIVILMRQNGPHRRHRLKEPNSEECEMVEYRNCHESVELKVPVEDNSSLDQLGGTTKA